MEKRLAASPHLHLEIAWKHLESQCLSWVCHSLRLGNRDSGIQCYRPVVRVASHKLQRPTLILPARS